MREKYDEFLEQKNNDEERSRALMELHGEDREFAPLFPMTPGEKDIHFRPYLFLAQAVGILTKDRDPSTGLQTMVLRTRNSVPRALGPSIDDILSKTTTDVLISVKTEVKDRISTNTTDEVSGWTANIEGLIVNLDKEYTSVLDPNRTKQELALRSALAMIRGDQ